MTKRTIDADAILDRAKPQVHQQPYEIQPYGHLVNLPIELSEERCARRMSRISTSCSNGPHALLAGQRASIPRPVAPLADGTVEEIPEVGGLHPYERRAA